MVEPALFGPLDAVLAPVVQYVVLALVLVNLVTRFLAHQRHRRQAREDAGAISRHPAHELSNVLLVLGTFYYLTIHFHSGMVLGTLVLGTVIADLFEFEARKVEAREDRELERPKGALVASTVALAYAAYISLFFVIEPLWSAIV